MPTQHNIEIVAGAFDPPTLTVQPGDSVVWTNRDSDSHTATFDFATTGNIEPGGTSDPIAFEEASGPSGLFYFCEIHPSMIGFIVVVSSQESDERVSTSSVSTVAEYSVETWQQIAQIVAAAWVYDMADDFLKAESVHGPSDAQLVKDAWKRIEEWWSAGDGAGDTIRNSDGKLDENRLLRHATEELEQLGRLIRKEYRSLGNLIFRYPHPARPDDQLEPGELFEGQSSDPFGKAITVNFIPKPIQEAYMDHQNYAGVSFGIESLQDAGQSVPDSLKQRYTNLKDRMSVIHYKILAFHQVQGLQKMFEDAEFDEGKFSTSVWRFTKRGEWDLPIFVGWHWLRWIEGYIHAVEEDSVIDLIEFS